MVGRAFLIIWPLSRVSDLPIPETFKQAGLSAAAALATAPPAAVAAARRRGRCRPGLAPAAPQAEAPVADRRGGRPAARKWRYARSMTIRSR